MSEHLADIVRRPHDNRKGAAMKRPDPHAIANDLQQIDLHLLDRKLDSYLSGGLKSKRYDQPSTGTSSDGSTPTYDREDHLLNGHARLIHDRLHEIAEATRALKRSYHFIVQTVPAKTMTPCRTCNTTDYDRLRVGQCHKCYRHDRQAGYLRTTTELNLAILICSFVTAFVLFCAQ